MLPAHSDLRLRAEGMGDDVGGARREKTDVTNFSAIVLVVDYPYLEMVGQTESLLLSKPSAKHNQL